MGHNSSTEKTSPELKTMDLSITFCNSQMLPAKYKTETAQLKHD